MKIKFSSLLVTIVNAIFISSAHIIITENLTNDRSSFVTSEQSQFRKVSFQSIPGCVMVNRGQLIWAHLCHCTLGPALVCVRARLENQIWDLNELVLWWNICRCKDLMDHSLDIFNEQHHLNKNLNFRNHENGNPECFKRF